MSTPSLPAPVSVPVTPQEPDLLAYGIQELALFTSYTRDSYLTAFGVQAPAWDPARVKKAWFDSTQSTRRPRPTWRCTITPAPTRRTFTRSSRWCFRRARPRR